MKILTASIVRHSRRAVALILTFGACHAEAQSPQFVHLQDFGQQFGGREVDEPVNDLLTAADGSFYGDYGGNGFSYLTNEAGIFRITASGNVTAMDGSLTYSMGGYTASDLPNSPMQGLDKDLYVTTQRGAYDGSGYFVQYTSSGQPSFIGDINGAVGALSQGADGTFYEVNGGGIFSTKSTNQLTFLYAFDQLDSSGHNHDGSTPLAGLVGGPETDVPTFYGTNSKGGAYGAGTIFKITITPDGVFTFSKLHDFNPSAGDGSNPQAALLLASDGNLYGTTVNGGALGDGAIFQVIPSTNSYKYNLLYSLNGGKDGIGPASHLVESDVGKAQYLYGTAVSGGAYGSGTIFSIMIGGKFSQLYAFTSTDNTGHNVDGASPNGLAVGNDGDIYGTTISGGEFAKGTAFEWITQKPSLSLKLSPTKIAAGSGKSAQLSWTSTSAITCYASGTPAKQVWTGNQLTSSSQPVLVSPSKAGTYTYTLTCSGPAGPSIEKKVTLTVTSK